MECLCDCCFRFGVCALTSAALCCVLDSAMLYAHGNGIRHTTSKQWRVSGEDFHPDVLELPLGDTLSLIEPLEIGSLDGQTKPVVIYRMLSTGTIEEKMFQRQLLKSEVSDCMGFSSGELTECSFSHGELRDVFTFNPDSTCDTQELLHRQHQTAS
eukprot:gene9681-11478_t